MNKLLHKNVSFNIQNWKQMILHFKLKLYLEKYKHAWIIRSNILGQMIKVTDV